MVSRSSKGLPDPKIGKSSNIDVNFLGTKATTAYEVVEETKFAPPPRVDSGDINTDTADIMIDVVPSSYPQFLFALGRGIAAWQAVEKSLCDVFAKVSTCRDATVAAAIYYGPRDFSEKLHLTHNAARLFFAGSPMLKEWRDLRKDLIDAVERRNVLAHFHITLQIPVGSSSTLVLRRISHAGELIGETKTDPKAKGLRLLLQPNSSDPNEGFKEHQKKSKGPMDLQDIMNTRRLFGTLEGKVKAFSLKIPPLDEQKK